MVLCVAGQFSATSRPMADACLRNRSLKLGRVFGLQGEQLGDRVAPALWPGAPVGGTPIADNGCGLLGLATSAIARLPFGIAELVVPFGQATASSANSRGARRYSTEKPSRQALCPSAQASQDLPTPVGHGCWRRRPLRLSVRLFGGADGGAVL